MYVEEPQPNLRQKSYEDGMLRPDRKAVLKLYEELFLKRLKLKELRNEIRQEREFVGQTDARYATLLRVSWAKGSLPAELEFEQVYEELKKGRDELGVLQYQYDIQEEELNVLEAELDELEAPLLELQQDHSMSETSRAASASGQTEEPSNSSTTISNDSFQYRDDSKLKQYQSRVGDGNILWERLQDKLEAYHRRVKFANLRNLGTSHDDLSVREQISEMETDCLKAELELEDLAKEVRDLADEAAKDGFLPRLPPWALPHKQETNSNTMTSVRHVTASPSDSDVQSQVIDLQPGDMAAFENMTKSAPTLLNRQSDNKSTGYSVVHDTSQLRPATEPSSLEHELLKILSVTDTPNLNPVPQRREREKEIFSTSLHKGQDKLRDAVNLYMVYNTGLLYRDQGKFKEAEEMYQRALEGCEQAFGAVQLCTLNMVNELGLLYEQQNKPIEAESMYRRLLEGYEMALGPEHATTLRISKKLLHFYNNQSIPSVAEHIDQPSHEGATGTLDPQHSSTPNAVNKSETTRGIHGDLGTEGDMNGRELEYVEKTLETEQIPTTDGPASNLPRLESAFQYQELKMQTTDASSVHDVMDLGSGIQPEDVKEAQDRISQLIKTVVPKFGNEVYSGHPINIWFFQQLEESSLGRVRYLATILGVWDITIDKLAWASCLELWNRRKYVNTALMDDAKNAQQLKKIAQGLAATRAKLYAILMKTFQCSTRQAVWFDR